jgi:lipopolysaccharide transport system permease protein
VNATPDLVIKPPGRFTWIRGRELWEFRDLLVRFARRDITLRYRQTVLGVIWVVLQPLMAAGIFTFVFGRVADLPSEGVPYFAFSFAGMLGWNLFNSTVTKFSASLTGNSGLVSKIFFPRLVLPFSTLGSTLLDFVVSLGMMVVVLLVAGVAPGWGIVTLPVWMLLALLVAGGIGLTAGALMVKYRDIGYVLPVVTQLLLYATPIAYSLSRVPEGAQAWVKLNPLTGVMVGVRWSLLDTAAPDAGMVAWTVGAAVVLFLFGATVFTRMERQFADVI